MEIAFEISQGIYWYDPVYPNYQDFAYNMHQNSTLQINQQKEHLLTYNLQKYNIARLKKELKKKDNMYYKHWFGTHFH